MAENNNAYPYLGYQETVGFESKKEQIKEMVQGIIDENNAVDNNQSELIAENTKKIEENTINDEKTVQNLEDEIAERKRMGNILNDKISVVQSSVEAEQTRAKSAEESLQAQINVLVEQHPSDIEQLKSDLNSETERAIAAEKANTEAIAAEQARAESKESELVQSIDTETERAKGEESAIRSEFAEADSKLQSEIDAIEVGAGLAIDGSYVVDSTRQYIKDAKSLAEADKILDYNLMQEAHERWVQDENIKSSIKELSNSLEAEKVERWNQDQKIRTDFTSADNALNEAISTEQARAEGKEAELAQSIADEQSRAMAAEQANAEAIAAEQVRAEGKEAELVQAIADEANVRGEQDANLHGEIVKLNETLVYNLGVLNEAYKVEQDARISGDNSLDERIKAIELVKFGDLEYSLVVDGVDKGTVNIPKDQFLKSVEHIIDENGKDFLVFSFEVKDSDELIVQKIDISKYIDIYTAGHGLNVQNNEFSIKLDDTTEKYISVSENGLKLFGIDNKISDVQNNLHSELKTAETSLEAKITNESARATQKETELLNSITAESETARKAEKANAEAIAAEQARAEFKEGELSQAIVAEKDRAIAAEQVNAEAIADEKARAEGKEGELAQAIADEKARAIAAEQANAEAIATEQTRAEGEETAIRGEVDAIKNELIEKVNGHVIVIDGNIRSVEEKISDEQARAMAAEQANAEAIVAEQNRAEAKEADLVQSIADETERAKGEESSIRSEFSEADSIMRGEIESNFSEEIQKVNESILSNTTLINELNISLADEQARAEAKEGELSQAIAAEQARAEAKEAELVQAIESEAKERKQKDDMLAQSVDMLGVIASKLQDANKELKTDVEANYALKSELPVVPTKVSELENDVHYLTEHQSLDAYSTIEYVDGKISEMSAIISALEARIKVLENRVYTPNELISKISELKSGDILDIELSSDITMSNLDRLVIPSGSVVNLNLNGNTIKYLDETIMFRVEGELVIENGSVEGNGYVASANEGGSIVVKDGSYTCSVTCFQSNGGSVKIYDGYYNCTSEKYGTTYTLNCIDAQAKKAQAEGRRLIDVYGGTFVDYNPQNSTSENPVMNFVAEGYKSVEQVDSEGNVTYIVVKE